MAGFKEKPRYWEGLIKLIEDFIPNNEYTKKVFIRMGNRVYSKKVEDKSYKLFKKFKNATKAKKFFKIFILDIGLRQMGKFYLSSR